MTRLDTATYNAHEDGAYRCYTLARDGRSRQYLDCRHPTPSEAIAHDPLSARGTAQDGPDPASRPDRHSDLAGPPPGSPSRDVTGGQAEASVRRAAGASRPAVIPDPAAVPFPRGAAAHHMPFVGPDSEPDTGAHGPLQLGL